jgi:hypothetical protein
MRRLGRPTTAREFIAATFEEAAPPIGEEPAAAISDYFNESGRLQPKDFGGGTFMRGSGDNIPALLMSSGNRVEIPEGVADDLTLSLAALVISLDSLELAAFVRDSLWRGEGAEAALSRCFAGVEEIGLPRKKVEALLREVRAFVQEVAEGWDGSAENPDVARIRSALLDIYAAFLGWMRSIGGLVASPSDLDTEEFSILSETM